MRVSRNNLIFTWKPDVLSMVEHAGNNDNYKGKTARSEVETFKNIKNIVAAKKILLRRNVSNIIVAKFRGEEIFVTPDKKQRRKFYKKQKQKRRTIAYSNKYSKITRK